MLSQCDGEGLGHLCRRCQCCLGQWSRAVCLGGGIDTDRRAEQRLQKQTHASRSFDKSAKAIPSREKSLLSSGAGALDIQNQKEKQNSNPHSTPCTKLDTVDHGLKWKHKLWHFCKKESFWSIKGKKIDKLGPIKIKNFCSTTDPVNRMKKTTYRLQTTHSTKNWHVQYIKNSQNSLLRNTSNPVRK